MASIETWGDLMFDLHCLTKSSAKKTFHQSIRYSFGGLCAYCRCKRATTLDHVKPKCRGGSNLRSNLVPACVECNHSKGSQVWLLWYKQQDFYCEVAKELIEEWVENKRYDIEELDDNRTNDRTAVRLDRCSI